MEFRFRNKKYRIKEFGGLYNVMVFLGVLIMGLFFWLVASAFFALDVYL